jgi:hypothetical protein
MPDQHAETPSGPPSSEEQEHQATAGPSADTEPRDPPSPAPASPGSDEAPLGDESPPQEQEEEVSRVGDQDRAQQQRQEREAGRRAQSNMTGENVFGSVYVARDVIFQQSATIDPSLDLRAQTGPIPDAVLDRLRRVYVEPTVYVDAATRLRERRVMVLRGPDGWGKRATALRLLTEVAPGGVFGLEPDIEIRRLGGRTLERK